MIFFFLLDRKSDSASQIKSKLKKRVITISEETFWELNQMLEVQDNETFDNLLIKVQENRPDIGGDGKNVTKILGQFIVSFIKKLSKKFYPTQNFIRILTKASKKLKNLEKQQYEDYQLWLKNLTYADFSKWVLEINLKRKITTLKSFRQIFGLTLVIDPSFMGQHFSVVLKRIVKHVLINEFSRYLLMNSMNKKNKQNWKNAVKYIMKIPKFLRAIKEPMILNNLNEK